MIEQLVKKAQKGNKKAFSQLIEFIKIDSYKLAYTYLKNEADSKDALCNAIEKALDNLSEHTRSLIMLKYYQQYTFAEISQIFDLSESTVKSQTYKGLQDMKSNLEVKEGNYA